MQTTSRTVVLRTTSIWASFREGEGGHIAIAMSLFEGYMTCTCTGRSAAGLPGTPLLQSEDTDLSIQVGFRHQVALEKITCPGL